MTPPEKQTISSSADPASWLRQLYIARRKRNPNYSIRAFARQLDIAAPRVCDVLNRKRKMTAGMAETIADRLELSPKQKQNLVNKVKSDRTVSSKNKDTEEAYSLLKSDVFESIAAWYHFAILELTRTKTFKWDYRWMGQRLGISSTEARAATERLIRLGLLEEKNRSLLLSKQALSTTHDIPSAALRKSHRETLELAISSLNNIPLEIRDITSITSAIDVDKIPQAKVMIKKFRRQLAKFLEQGNRTEVYNLNIQLVPVTKGG